MSFQFKALSLGVMLVTSAGAKAADWQLQPAEADQGAALTFGAGEPVSYRFECAPTELIVTQTGVTKLVDFKTGKTVGDDAQATMPDGAAMMALFAGKGDPQFIPAKATKNPAGGWDLTIRLPKADKQIKAVSKGEMLSLFTTGYTMAVAMNPASRTKWKEFMQRCQIAA